MILYGKGNGIMKYEGKITKRFVCILAAVALILTLLPAAVLAQDAPAQQQEPAAQTQEIGEGGHSALPAKPAGDQIPPENDITPPVKETQPIVVASFDELENASYEITAGGELPALPDSLVAADADGEPLAIGGVTWECETFDVAIAGEYVFTAKLPEGYSLPAPDAKLPQITVKVGEAMRAMNNAPNTTAGPFAVTLTNGGGAPAPTDYTYTPGILTITSNTPMTIANLNPNTATNERIVVQSNLDDVKLTLAGVNINTAADHAFDMAGATVYLTLVKGNFLKTTQWGCAGLHAPRGATLTIDGGGSLTANGGSDGAGIGGGDMSAGGDVTINGGTISATGDSTGAGIGGGLRGSCDSITINGGTISATGMNGAGIGSGGDGGNGGSITINGGTISATGTKGAGVGGGDGSDGGDVIINGGSVHAESDFGEGIGKGKGGTGSGTLKNSRGGELSRDPVVLTLDDAGMADRPVTWLKVGVYVGADKTTGFAANEYGIHDMKTDGDGKIYLYLPEAAAKKGTGATALLDGGQNEYSGAFGENRTATLKPLDGNIDLGALGAGNNLYIWNDRYGIGPVAGNAEIFFYNRNYTLKGVTTQNTVTVMADYNGFKADGTPDKTITLNGLKIDVSANLGQCAFSLEQVNKVGASVSLVLEGSDNALRGGGNSAGLHVPEGAALTIGGRGSLTATGSDGAGIGGNVNEKGGNITINGGTISATSNYSGAGIGGGNGGNGGDVIINGGSVHAVSTGGEGIGKGNGGAGSGTLKSSLGGELSRDPVVLTLEDAGMANRPVTWLQVGDYTGVDKTTGFNEHEYGIHGMKTDGDGKVYLYLPEDAVQADTKASLRPGGTTLYSGAFDQVPPDARKATLRKEAEGTIDLSKLGAGNNLYIWDDYYGVGSDADEAEANKLAYSGDYTLAGGTEPQTIKNTVTVMADYQGLNAKGEALKTITLNGLYIDVSEAEKCAFSLEKNLDVGAGVSLTLAENSTNTLKSGGNSAGLHVPEGAALTIGGNGSLTATGGDGAGIGGGSGSAGGKTTITGGTISATGGHRRRRQRQYRCRRRQDHHQRRQRHGPRRGKRRGYRRRLDRRRRDRHKRRHGQRLRQHQRRRGYWRRRGRQRRKHHHKRRQCHGRRQWRRRRGHRRRLKRQRRRGGHFGRKYKRHRQLQQCVRRGRRQGRQPQGIGRRDARDAKQRHKRTYDRQHRPVRDRGQLRFRAGRKLGGQPHRHVFAAHGYGQHGLLYGRAKGLLAKRHRAQRRNGNGERKYAPGGAAIRDLDGGRRTAF